MITPKLLDQVRSAIRVRHYSRRTEDSYVHWIRRFILFHGKRHPSEMGEREITAFLSDLAVTKHVAASTQNQALAAILFLYQKTLNMKLDWLEDVVRAKRPRRLPSVLTRDEVHRLLDALDGTPQLIARLMYGTGMRLLEALRLRVKDLDFVRHQVVIRDGYDIRTVQELLGHKDQNTTMIYTHVLNRGGRGIRSPLDRITSWQSED